VSAHSATGVSTLRKQPRSNPENASARCVRVLVADDHPLTLDGIRAVVQSDATLQIVGEATDGPAALERAIELNPDVAVLDLSMPGFDGVELARQIIAACPACRIMTLGLREDAPQLRRLLDLGVAGCVLKSSDSLELTRCVRSIAQGGVYLDPGIAGALVGLKLPAAAAPEPRTELSARQIEVLRLAALGHSTKSIAAHLRIGPKSVETYKARAMAKLGIAGRVDLVRFAAAEGWLERA
jgi:DNA-binding NarL/FixJ family response regulator